MDNNETILELSSPTTQPSEQGIFDDPVLMKAIDSIPDKMAFKIGEVAELADVQPYVLRYWETEFDEIRPKKSNHNQRMYTRHDVKMVLMIKKLLHKDRFSIEGARKAIRRLRTEVKKETKIRDLSNRNTSAIEKLQDVVEELQSLKSLFA
jgi:DNA-binding transcriptional MerR regulator